MKISEDMKQMVPYKPGKPLTEAKREYNLKEIHKLASNENPLGVSPKAMQAIQKHLGELNIYPDPTQHELVNTLSQKWGFKVSQISAGNGSDEIIEILTRIFCAQGEGMLTSQAAFAAYEVSAQASRVKIYKTPLTKDYKFDLDSMVKFYFDHPEHKIKIIFIANPNNPTGTYNNNVEIENFLEKLGNREDLLIVFDEAYTEFVRASDYPDTFKLMKKYSNLAVVRTFSKIYGLAGLRIGALVAPEDVVDIFNRVRKPFNVNSLAQVAAVAALHDSEFIEASQKITWEGLDYFYKELEKLKLPFVPSQGNFVMFDTQRNAQLVFEGLLKKGIIARPIVNYGFKTQLRLSCGSMKQNVAAIKALSEVLKEIN